MRKNASAYQPGLLALVAKRSSAVAQWLPVLIGTSVAIATLCLWQALLVQEQAKIKRTIEIETASLKNEIDKQIDARIMTLVRLAKRWEYTGKPRQDEWEFEAGLNVKNSEAYQAIEWVDSSYHIRWIVPLAGNEAAKDLSLAFKPRRWDALVVAQDGRDVAVTRSIDLVQGRKGFLVCVPIFQGDSFDGFIVGVFRTQDLLDAILENWKAEENISSEYSIAIFDGTEEIYSRNRSRHYQKEWSREMKINLRNITWQIVAWPSPSLLAQERSPLPEVALVGGLLSSLLLAFAIYLAQKAQLRAKEAEVANQELDKQIIVRQQAEEALQQAHDKLEIRVEERTVELAQANKQLRNAENEIRNALETEKELSELKSRFITTASHEFRTPLAIILSSTELIEHYSHKWSEEKKLTHLHRIQLAVKNMTHLLNDVLLIGKAEAGKLEFDPAPLDLTQFCRDLVEEMQVSTVHPGDRSPTHPITFSSQGHCTDVVMDKKLLRHILSNLLSNALKYSPKGETVLFDLICRQPREVIFYIQDKGIGIPLADQAKLFDSFYRASNVGTISGTGLGLAIVKKSTDLHGGTIAVESKVGMGSTFTVTLPLNKQV